MRSNLSLGIDIGTTKVAAVIADPKGRVIKDAVSLDHRAALVNEHVLGSFEQSVDNIFNAVKQSVSRLDHHARRDVGAIGITGQMHGVVLFDWENRTHSNLITWQDNRCNQGDFLSELQELTGERTLRSGYGACSLAWLAKHEPQMLSIFNRASTIHGYLATRMCNSPGGMDPSDAASFGLFDILSSTWRKDQIASCGVNPSILPQIVRAPQIFGLLEPDWATDLGLPIGIPLITPIGDNQASLYGSLSDPESQIALTVGTGAQVSVVLSEKPKELPNDGSTYEIRPYLDDRYIAVGACLGGGRTLAAFAKLLTDFLTELGVKPLPNDAEIYSVLLALAEPHLNTDLVANPSFAGERHDPQLRGSLTSISFENFTAGNIFAALSRGTVDSLKGMLPSEMYHNRSVVVGSGNAIRRSKVMQKCIEKVFKMQVAITPGDETTCSGAAFLAGRSL